MRMLGKKQKGFFLLPNRRLRNYFLLSLQGEKLMVPSLNRKFGHWGLLPQHKFCLGFNSGVLCLRLQETAKTRTVSVASLFCCCYRGFLHKQQCGWKRSPGGDGEAPRGVWGQMLFLPLTPCPWRGVSGAFFEEPRSVSVLLAAQLFRRSHTSCSPGTVPPSKTASVTSSTTFALYSH